MLERGAVPCTVPAALPLRVAAHHKPLLPVPCLPGADRPFPVGAENRHLLGNSRGPRRGAKGSARDCHTAAR